MRHNDGTISHALVANVLAFAFLYFLACLVQQSGGQDAVPMRVFGPVELKSVSVHGTIDVIVATREGFVLATDSRATRGDGTHSDDAQKLFRVGKRTACVIAGLVGADIGAEGFHLTDSLGSHLVELDHWAQDHPVGAYEVSRVVADGLDSVSGLLLPVLTRPIFDGEVSIVSIDPSGTPEWVTFAIPFNVKHAQGESFFESAAPLYFLHTTNLGLRFDVQALGQPQVANALINARGGNAAICGTQPGQPGWCVDPTFTHSAVMREFYLRKRLGTLDGFTLKSGIELAKILIQATLKAAQPSWGVGGPVDILTVTKTGADWVVQKREQTLPPPFRRDAQEITMVNGLEPLDGLQCLLCTFRNMKLFYQGSGRVELVRPKFEGSCELTLGNTARQQRPDDVKYLERIVSGHCQIKDLGR